MTTAEFEQATPATLEGPLLALWHDRQGNWQQAHEVAQELDTPEGAWVHAYLHRKEGDSVNARYWYRRAGRPDPRGDLAAEWESIVHALLSA